MVGSRASLTCLLSHVHICYFDVLGDLQHRIRSLQSNWSDLVCSAELLPCEVAARERPGQRRKGKEEEGEGQGRQQEEEALPGVLPLVEGPVEHGEINLPK